MVVCEAKTVLRYHMRTGLRAQKGVTKRLQQPEQRVWCCNLFHDEKESRKTRAAMGERGGPGPEIFETASRGLERMRSFAKRGFFLRFGMLFRRAAAPACFSLPQIPHHQPYAATSLCCRGPRNEQRRYEPGSARPIECFFGCKATPVLMRSYRRSCGARSLPHDGRPPWLLDV